MVWLNSFIDSIQSFLAKIPSPFKSYEIPMESFKQQFQGVDERSLREVQVKFPTGGMLSNVITYKANTIKVIKCFDRKNSLHELINGPEVESRITMTNGKRTILFFDTFYLFGNALVGKGSRFISSFVKIIPLDEIKKIEVQNSHKRYGKINY